MAADGKDATLQEAAAAPAAAAAKPAGMGGLMVVLVVTVMLSTAASGGIAWWLSTRNAPPAAAEAEAVEPEKKEPANYLAMTPAFVVNLEGSQSARFLQVDIEVMTRDPAIIDEVKLHTPRIRSSLLMLLGQQKVENIATREGKERLQAEVLAEVQRILTEETGEPGVEAVYFTAFVMQ